MVAAIVGLVLVFTTHGSKGDTDKDSTPDTSPPTSQVQAPAPGRTQPPALAPSQPAQPAQPPKKDDDD
ncbi:MAG TPA: hypothetical protein VGH99_09410 [Pseudonocardia sp.]|jgi:hypothetical protein